MKSVEILSKTDRTSWSRIVMVWRFYSPCIGWQLWLFPLLSVVIGALCLLIDPGKHLIIRGMLASVLSLALIFSALAFSSPRGREVEAMLPALGAEKCIVILTWTVVVVPLLLHLPAEAMCYIVHGMSCESYTLSYLSNQFGAADQSVFDIAVSAFPQCMAIGYISTLAMVLSCLWGVFGARRHPAVWGVLSAAICYVAVIFLVFAASLAFGVYWGIQAGLTGASVHDFSPVEFSVMVVNTLTCIMVPVCIIYAIFACVKCCRAIACHQV